MNIRNTRGNAWVLASIALVLFIVVIVMANRWLEEQAEEIVSKPEPVMASAVPPKMPDSEKKTAPKVMRTGEVTRKTRYGPDRTFAINIFYQDGEEIARNKSTREGVYDEEGEIPDGKVSFVNVSDGSYGVENYYKQKPHGPARVFYSDGALKQEMTYQYGKLTTCTEYYYDGSVRMEEDYTDARSLDDNGEAGIGKIYFRDGMLKYEWHLTVTDPVGFKKSYDQRGRLTAAFYYDEFGQSMEHLSTGTEAADPAAAGASSEAGEEAVTEIPGTDLTTSPLPEKPPKQIYLQIP